MSAPEPEDWLAVGFESPEQAFRTWQTGLGGDRPSLEYRALSSALKAREGLSELGYREFRDDLLHRMPWLAQAANAEVLEVQRISDSVALLRARVRTLVSSIDFVVRLVREDFWELRDAEGLVDDDFRPFGETTAVQEWNGRSWLVARVPLAARVEPSELSKIVVGREWKIDAFEPIEPEDSEPSP